ncbi:MAG: hypothetical protein WC465_05005 [Patescibacteria group bacterium]
MREFYSTKTGTNVEVTTSFKTNAPQPLIPADTKLLCNVLEAAWVDEKTFTDRDTGVETVVPESVNVILSVVELGPYYGFIVKDNLKVFAEKEATAKNAEKKLMTYDALGTGLLAKTRNAGKNIVNNDAVLARSLNGVEAVATFGVWELGLRTGNWVTAIESPSKEHKDADKAATQKTPVDVDDFDSIPF